MKNSIAQAFGITVDKIEIDFNKASNASNSCRIDIADCEISQIKLNENFECQISIFFKKCKIKFNNNDIINTNINILSFEECLFDNNYIELNKDIKFHTLYISYTDKQKNKLNLKIFANLFAIRTINASFDIFEVNFEAIEYLYLFNNDFNALNFKTKKSLKNNNETDFDVFICKSCNFKENVDFSNLKFNVVEFNNSIFEKFVDFHESIFQNTACFYGVKFKTTPNFSAVRFNNMPNFINAKFNFDFEKIKSDCKCEFNRRNENKCKSYDKDIDKQRELNIQIYNDFRASFELLKKIHNDSGNSIDALNHHKAELYCKEMALEAEFIKKQNKIDNKKKEISKTIQTKTNIRLFFEMILHCLNLFFKAFCHTILTSFKFLCKSLYNVIFICFILLCVIVFVPILLLGDLFSTKKCAYVITMKRKVTMLKRAIKNKFEKSKNNQKISNLIDYSLLNIYRNTSNHHTNLLLILNFTVFMVDIYMIFWFINFKISHIANHFFNNISLGYFVIFMIEIIVSFFIIFYFVLEKAKKYAIFDYLGIIYMFLILFLMWFVETGFIPTYTASGILLYISLVVLAYILFKNFYSMILIFFSYFFIILVLGIKPELINPILNISNLSNKENKILNTKLNKLTNQDLQILFNISNYDFNLTNLQSSEILKNADEIINQREVIILRKDKMAEILNSIYAFADKNSIDEIIDKLSSENTENLRDYLKKYYENDNKSVLVDLYNYASYKFDEKFNILDIKTNLLIDYFGIRKDEIDEAIDEAVSEIIVKKEELKAILAITRQTKYKQVLIGIQLDQIYTSIHKSTYILFFIIMLLCVYSLTKTSRRNSIIPN